LNTKNTITNNTDSLEAVAPEVVQAKIVSAACCLDGVTGGAALYKVKGDTSKEWKNRELLIHAPYKAERAILEGMVGSIEAVLDEVGLDKARKLEITCVVYSDVIVRGFNNQKETWEANGFINRRGNKVKESRYWKQLFSLAEACKITVRKPTKYSTVLKGCTNRARMVAQAGLQYKRDAEVMAQVADAVAKDRS
tara:strand:+ start:6923 stop:7507 length:585 start_codon:yes stop_codon:yes gene_type:complete